MPLLMKFKPLSLSPPYKVYMIAPQVDTPRFKSPNHSNLNKTFMSKQITPPLSRSDLICTPCNLMTTVLILSTSNIIHLKYFLFNI